MSRLEQRVCGQGLESWNDEELLRAAHLLEKDIYSDEPLTSEEQREIEIFGNRTVSLPSEFAHLSEEELEREVQALREELKDYGFGSA